MKKLIYLLLVSILLLGLLVPGSVLANNSSNPNYQKVSENQTQEYVIKNHPTISNKKLGDRPVKYSDPVPESEMTQIYFTKTWLNKNDKAPDPYTVRISFPKSWINNPPQLRDNEKTIKLSVPITLLMLNNESKNQNEITVTFPSYYFQGLPIKPLTSIPIEQTTSTKSRGMDYIEAIWFDHTAGSSITGARGRVVPYSYVNTYGESFLTYQEIEFHGNTTGDVVEIISDISSTPSVGVWFAVFKDDPNYDNWEVSASISASIGDTVNYEFTSLPGSNLIYCYLQNGVNWTQDYVTDTSAPTDYEYFVGSSELDPIGGMSYPFQTTTSPITIEDIKANGTWHIDSTYVDQRLDYYGISAPANYVAIYYSLNAAGLYFTETAIYP